MDAGLTLALIYGPTIDLDAVAFRGNCRVTGKPYCVVVFVDDYVRYRQGAYVQNAFFYLSAEDREWIMSRTSPEGWNIIFSDLSEES